MEEKRIKESTEEFEQALKKIENQEYILRLYITGRTPKALRAIENIEKICKEHLEGRYELEVIDLVQHPELAESDQIVAIPTLIKRLPIPLRKYIGDMSSTENILVGLDLLPKQTAPTDP